MSWLFPTFGIPIFPASVSAAIVQSSKDFDQQSLFDSDDDLLNNNKIHKESITSPFGSIDPAVDEENDAKLYVDIVESIKQWQQNKIRKIRQQKSHHR